jgi:putative ABC transport system permease protein
VSVGPAVASAIGDIRYAVRMLVREPWFSAAAIFILAIGIGANTAVFSLANAVVFNPYPFPQQDRIVLLLGVHSSGQNHSTGYRDFLDWREQSASYEEMAIAPNSYSVTLTGNGEPERLQGFSASSGIFKVLGVQPFLGRTFTAEEDRPGAPRVAVLSYPAWKRLFAGSPNVLNRSMILDGNSHTILGILPESVVFPGLGPCDFWAPLREDPARGRYQHQYGVLARLKPGVSQRSAQAEISGIAQRLAQQYPESNRGWGVEVMTLREALAGGVRKPVGALFLAVFTVLLLACANVAGLQLARASARAREIGIRTSLGASRLRILRQLLTESVLLSFIGGLGGLLAARWTISLLVAAAPENLALATSLRLDPLALAFAACASLVTGIVSGLAPALHASKTAHIVRGGSAGMARSRNRTLSALVAAEVGLSMVLLAAALQLTSSLAWQLATDTGIRPDGVITFGIHLPRARYGTGESGPGFYRDLLARLRAAPGVVAAAAVDSLPMSGGMAGGGLEIEGRAKPEDWMDATGQTLVSTPDYFRTMGIRILRGRDFDERDTAAAPAVGIVSDLLARRFFSGEDPIGHRIKDAYGGWRTIVGVVGTVRHEGPTGQDQPQLYHPHAQSRSLSMWVVIQTVRDPSQLASTIRGTVRSVDPGLVVMKLRTMREVISDSLSEPRMLSSFLSGFAVFALLLGVIGMYGSIAYSVAQRTKELGVRLALGASRAGVLLLVLKKAALLTLIGVGAGIPASIAASRLMGSWLHGSRAHSPAVYVLIPLLLMGVSLLASYLPARRAANVDPAITLRDD